MPSPAFVFTPEVIVRIRNHARRGLDAGEIAYLLGCTATTVLNICKEHGVKVRLRGRQVPGEPLEREPAAKQPRLALREIGLLKRADTALAREAEIRGMTPAALAAKIVETVALDSLWKAVLDE